jgi:hypothetical protein
MGFAVAVVHSARATLEQIRRCRPEVVIFSAQLMDNGTAELVRGVRTATDRSGWNLEERACDGLSRAGGGADAAPLSRRGRS